MYRNHIRTDIVILNHRQITRMTPEPGLSLQTSAPVFITLEC
ncbi:unnamed protein product, partial [Larinioides sclopetarius]